jgi:hypothetical protein
MPDSERTAVKRQWHWEIWLFGVIAALVAALEGNMIWVDSRTRAASPREGGKIINTDIEPANATVDGDGPPILLLHGFGAAIDWWDAIAPALATHHRVIRLDLIGHGGTAAPTRGYSIPRQAQLAAAVLDRFDIGHVTVIGHSMGGEVAGCACRASASTDRSHDPDRQPAHRGHVFYDNDQNLSHANHRRNALSFPKRCGDPERSVAGIRTKLHYSGKVRS